MKKLPIILVAISALVLVDTTNVASGEEIGFAFAGFVDMTLSSPFGHDIDEQVPVNGRFIFDTESAATHILGNCQCVGYRQQIVGGFSADFGDVHVRVDDYVVEVANDYPQPDGSLADVISIRFADNIAPKLKPPIVVNGSAFSNGVFDLTFLAFDGWSSTALPQEIDFSLFSSSVNRLSDSTGFFPPAGILYSVSELQAFPVIEGDYNFDGRVNASDFDVWLDNFGSTGRLAGDGNRNGVVDAADFIVWRDNANRLPIAVPEPIHVSSTSMLIIALLFARLSHARRR